jgi:hypothetical protein
VTGVGLGLGGSMSPLGLPGSTTFSHGTIYSDTLSETLGMARAASPILAMSGVASDTITSGETMIEQWRWAKSVTDDIGVSSIPEAIRRQFAEASDVIQLSYALSSLAGVVVLEQLRIALSDTANHNFQFSLSDAVGMAEVLVPGIPVTLAETIGLAAVEQAQQALAIIEGLGIGETLTPILTYALSVSDGVGIADTLAQFFGGEISEGIGVSYSLAGIVAKSDTIAETIGLAPSLAPQLVVRAIAADTMEFEDANVLNMLFQPALADGIEFAAAYLGPGDSITTWAMNTRTGAVTEYSNYAFNSFAKMGHKYLGASQSGLYELLGDDDAGTDIIAQIKSGFAQWAGSKFTMFKGAYLGVRGGGDFVLRLTTGDGKTYNYSVEARDMRTTKVNVGKGLRARYFAFELISTGQDFDLDSIEFVPLIAERRV